MSDPVGGAGQQPLLGAWVRPGPWARLLTSEPIPGLAAVVLDTGDGPPSGAVLVTSRQQAAAALAAGRRLVLYDVAAMVQDLFTPLADLAPAPGPGVREPLVMLPGMLGDSTVWDAVAEQLADLVQPWPARIDLEDSVEEAAQAVLAEAPARFALVGHSLGAIVALEIVRTAPRRVSRVALVNASGRGASPEQLATWAGWRGRTRAGEFDAVAAELARLTLPASRRGDAELVAAGERMAARVGGEGFLRQLAAQSTRPQSLDRLAEIDVPVLVVAGALDQVCPPALQQELVDHCPRAWLETVEGAGHMLPLEAPGELAARLRTWARAG